MASNKTIQLVSVTPGEFHDFDEARLERIREEWRAPVIKASGLPQRPVRPYPPYGLPKLIEDAGCENGWSIYRSHYAAISSILRDPTFQISKKEATHAFLLETRPEKFSDYSNPSIARHADADDLTEEQVLVNLKACFDDFCTLQYGAAFASQAILPGLMSIIVGPLATVQIWSSVTPPEAWFDYFSTLTESETEQEELALRELLAEHLEQTPMKEWTDYHLGALARAPNTELMKRACEEIPEKIGMGSSGVTIMRAAGCSELFGHKLVFSELAFEEEGLIEVLTLGGFEAAAAVCGRVGKIKKVNARKAAIKLFDNIHTEQLVEPMLSLYKDKKVGKLAERWLLHEGANAISGLIRLIENRSNRGKLCAELLCRYRDMGHADLIETVLDGIDDEKRAKVVHEKVLDHYMAEKEVVASADRPDWFETLVADSAMRRKSMPKFLELESLPPCQTRDGELLSLEGVEWLVRAMKESTLESPHGAIAKYREWLDPTSAAWLCEALLDGWVRAGAHANYAWILDATIHFGTLYTPGFLLKHIKKWGKDKSASKQELANQASRGLQVLYMTHEHRTGLRALIDLESELDRYSSYRYRSLQKECESILDAIAASKGVPRTLLCDLAVPTLGFNERGERDFDYGSRHFTLKLDETLSPRFIDPETREARKNLPRSRKTDDAEKVDRAKEAYARDKKLLASTIAKQTNRFERAMEEGERWPIEHWRTLILEHPLVKNYARRLLWYGKKSGQGSLVFRVTEDFQVVDVEDEEFTLTPESEVRLARAKDFSSEQGEAWARVLVDYEVVQPFTQIDLEI